MFNSRLIMLFVFRLIAAPIRRSDRATRCELWQHCREAGIKLSQEEPPAETLVARGLSCPNGKNHRPNAIARHRPCAGR